MLNNLKCYFPQKAVLSIISPLSFQMTHAVIFKYRTRFWKS